MLILTNDNLYLFLEQLMEAPEESIVNLVKKLMYFESEVFNLRRAVDSMEELSARLYGLPDAADLRLIENSSRYV